MQVAVVNRVVQVGLVEKVAFEQRLEEGGGVSHVRICVEEFSRQQEQTLQRL